MALDFMVIGLPRSGTTWAANWLTTDAVHCVHDPLYRTHYEQWDDALVAPGKISGVSCTGIWRWTDWLNCHPARKLILHRDHGDIVRSMMRLGLPCPSFAASKALDAIEGLHVHWSEMFERRAACGIWEYLTLGGSFDAERHAALVGMHIQPRFQAVQPDPKVTARLFEEINRMVMS